MATPLSGKSQNSPGKIKTATYGPLRGKQSPQVKKINIPLPVRQDDGQLRMGKG